MGRVLHLISHLEEGGAQRQLSYTISFAKKHEPEIASLIASPADRLFPPFRNIAVPIHFLSYSNDFYAPEIVPALQKLLSNGQFSLVHCWLYQSIVQGVIVSRLHGVPCIASPRSMLTMLDFEGNKRWERFLIRKTIPMAQITVVPSYSVAMDLVEARWVERNRVRVVYNGVDCDHFFPVLEGDAIVAVGRQSVEKAYPELASILRRLRERIGDVRCLVAGGGKADFYPEIEMVGQVRDIREVLKQAAIFLSASLTEGMSNALLEAQAMGIPAVVRRLGSNSEIIEHGINGFLAGNEGDFVEACERLLKEPALRREMGQNARSKMMAEFSASRQIERIEAVYDELL